MIEGNTISGHTTNQASGIYLIGLDKLNNIYGNNIIQNNTYGIFLSSSNYTNITGNRINMNTVGLAIGVYSHDINLFGNNLTLNEVAYNITNTTNFTFSGDYDNIGFDFSVEIQTGGMYINSSIPVSADPFGFTNLSRYVNITNHSAVILTLIIPYSDNDLSSLSLDESSLEIMKFDGSKWIGIPATLDKSNNIIQSGNINSFSVFALFARPLVENSISNSKKNINLIPSFVCSTGELEITAKYSQLKLKGIKINLGEKSVITDSLGSAVFTISEDGLYFIYSDPTSKYNGENIKISLSLCIEEEEPEVQNHSRIKENPEHVTDIVETISETVQNTVPKITEEISSIGKEIELPAETDAQETKDTVEPEKEKTLDVYSLILWLIVLIALIIAYLFYRSRK